MDRLPQFEVLRVIQEKPEIGVYRARRREDGAVVGVKLLRAEYPDPRQIAMLRREYAVTRDLEVPGVLRALAFVTAGWSAALILEDFEGEALHDLARNRRLPLAAILRIFIALADTLVGVHANRILHKDIKPKNILVNSATGAVKLTDFGIAAQLTEEAHQPLGPDLLEGSLAYMSPEQTGRMNRSLDERTDLYSLGVTLYEVLTGALPFRSADPAELLHSHIARTPTPPHVQAPHVPEVLSGIVMKLLAKNPEDRYQGAHGLEADLLACLSGLDATGHIAPFPLASRDVSSILRIPQTLYGRAEETRSLQRAFEHCVAGGVGLVLITGHAGVGKSALVGEVRLSIARQGGYFAAGKFDQLGRNVPYAAVTQALRELFRQVLGEAPGAIDALRNRLLDALGPNGRLLTDLVPELEKLIGRPPEVAALGPTEAANRFHGVMQDFLRALTGLSRPLVLFLDDLQWADSASLGLLGELLIHPQLPHLLVIGAYRDNEVDASHATLSTIDAIKKSGARVEQIRLGPLTLPSVTALLADALHVDRERTAPLAELLLQKTGGNPFFLRQLLRSLREGGQFELDTTTGAWTWDIAKIRGVGITDNVIELMTDKLRRLPQATQDVLKLAACIGNTFELGMVSVVYERSERQTAARLWPAVREGLLVRLSDSHPIFQDDEDEPEGASSEAIDGRLRYRFLHDRVQQAAYSLIPEDQRKIGHAKIGRLLLANPERREEDLFDIVAHLDVARDLLRTDAERLELAELNRRAGKRAKAATAITVASEHFAIALELLPPDRWETHYELTRELHCERGECVYLLGDYDRSDELLTEAIAHGRTRYDKALALECRMRLYLTRGALDARAKGVAIGLEALRVLGFDMPETREGRAARAIEQRQQVDARLASMDVQSLADLPRMADPERLLVMTTLVTLFGAAFLFGDFDLVQICSCSIIGMSLDHGNSEASAFGYTMYGMLVSNAGDRRRGYELGRLGLSLLERYPDPTVKPKIHNIFAHSINPYINHFETNLPHYRAAYESILESGDLVYGVWCVVYILWVQILKGDTLGDIYDGSAGYVGFVERTGDTHMLLSVQCQRQAVQSLRGLTAGMASLDSDGFREAAVVQQFHDSKNVIGLCWHALLRTIVDLTFERYAEAAAHARVAEGTIGALFAFFNSTTHYFHSALALAAFQAEASEEVRRADLALIEGYADKLKVLAKDCSDNFLHCHQLVEAERARLAGDTWRAAELYDLAIDNAQKGRFLNHVALGLELAARFYLATGRQRMARVYMTEAYNAYARWGADGKVRQLEQRHPQLLERKEGSADAPNDWRGTTTSQSSLGLDLDAVVKAAQALAGELLLDRLIERVMRIVVESSGAQRGVLVLAQGGELRIAATMAIEPAEIAVGLSAPALDGAALPASIVNTVVRTMDPVVLDDARQDVRFGADPYIAAHGIQSALCLAMMHQGRLSGVLYLENAAAAGAFTPARVGFCGLVAAQAAIAVENALLIDRIRQKSEALTDANARLERELEDHVLAQEALADAYARVDAELLERKRGEEARAALEAELVRVQTPLIPITDRIMVMPLIGVIDERRAAQVLETSMRGVQATGAEVVILDITGVAGIDATVLSSILRAVDALRLLGTKAVITGMRSEVARKVVELGVNLGPTVTMATLQHGVEYAMRKRDRKPGGERRGV
ncbi:AAA family ATPase [Polyangium aurulentum]|uniref:AAA family ATPase n=1 Tax=Polyangium aurulentum TaxID=2567896 RepID=UPI0010ADAA28|nr:AAA family ATPase [Polyangium aurulentum]UQA56697.1 AAA family ATPase [Polyangium aurulentum]